MRASDLNFPYPVLGMHSSIGGPAPIVRNVPHLPPKERISEPYRWDFEVEISNKDILDLIDNDKAEYMCEVMCSATLLRRCFTSKSPKFTVEIGRKDVNKRLEFSLYVVAKERISEYRNADAHPDYRELEPFDIDKGAPLAVLASYHWDADLCYEDLTSLKSILQIIENTSNPKEEYAVLDTEGDYIKLELPPSQYKAFIDVSAEVSIADVFHSTLVLFALQGALSAYTKEKTHRWERALELMIQRDDRFKDYELGNKDDAAAIAIRLLDNPFKRLSISLPPLVPQAVASVTVTDVDDGDDE